MAKQSPSVDPNLDVDYAIVYRFAETGKAQAVSHFKKLIEALSSVGLTTEVRNGENHSVLVFVKLESDEHLYAEVYRSRTKDWLHGVRSAQPEKDSEASSDRQQLYPAERLRIVYQLITNPVEEGGAGITSKYGDWKCVESIFALHDPEYNKRWLKKWATQYTLKSEDLDDIRDRFGEKVAFYFAFTQAYFSALVVIAAFGVSAWVILGNFSIIYAIINSLLCVTFVEYWKHQEYDLAVRWGVRGVSAIENKRHDFWAEKEVTDPLTGEKVQIFPDIKRFQRQLLQVPFALLAFLALSAVIATCFSIEIFMSEIYKGPGQSLLVFLPTGIITTVQPLILGALTTVAERLTAFENHQTDLAYDTAMTQKIFVLNFITSYLPIFLTAFVYVPFAAILVPYLDIFRLTVQPLATNEKQVIVPQAGRFQINPDRLKKQVIYFTVTAQIVNQALEIVVPYLKRRGFSTYKEMQSKRAARAAGGDAGAGPAVSANDPPEEATFLKRVRQEAELDNYDVTSDLREMVMQYGYLVLFSVVWPLTSVSFLVNNWFELRTDAAKICTETQRPTPWRADSIGPWLDSLGFLTWLGSISTAAIVYMFSGGDGGPGGNPESIKGWGLLLAIFTCEHSYLLVQWAVQLAISKMDSPGRSKERAERYIVRKRYLEESRGSQAAKVAQTIAPEKITRSSLEEEARLRGHESGKEKFWGRQRGWEESASVGAALIEASAGAESKKAQ